MTHHGILYPKMTVIGCGLIGGSIIRAAREHGVVGEITVADASAGHRARVVELGIADHVTDDIADAVKDADLVVIATPVLSTPEVAAALAPHMKAGATLTDVGSTKANVAEAFRALGRDGAGCGCRRFRCGGAQPFVEGLRTPDAGGGRRRRVGRGEIGRRVHRRFGLGCGGPR